MTKQLKVRFFDIIWDTDEESEELPNSVTFDVNDDVDLETEAADILSDRYGWCVCSLNYEIIVETDLPKLGPEYYPTVDDCKTGLWCKLSNDWIVGPIVYTKFSGVYVGFADGTWQLDIMGQMLVDEDSTRLVVKVGEYRDLVK